MTHSLGAGSTVFLSSHALQSVEKTQHYSKAQASAALINSAYLARTVDFGQGRTRVKFAASYILD
jgi:hypothetical protein